MKFRIIIFFIVTLFILAMWLAINYRLGNPGKINVLGDTEISDGSITIKCPVVSGSIESGYYQDGGTLMVRGIDANGKSFVFCINHIMGHESEWGDIYYGIVHPKRAGGINLGKSKLWNKFVYSVAVLDKNVNFRGDMAIDHWYPKLGRVIKEKWVGIVHYISGN